MCQQPSHSSNCNEYVVNSALSHCEPSVLPSPPSLSPTPGVKAKLVMPRVIGKHMMMPPAAQPCTLLNPPSATAVVLHQPQAEDRRRSSGYQSTVSSPLPAPASPTEDLSICPRCGRCRCQQCREPQPLPRRRVYGRCVVSDKCCVDVLSCMAVPKLLFDHCCCVEEEDRRRPVPGITVSSACGPKSSISGSDSGLWWGGPSSVSFDDAPCLEVDPASPRPSATPADWLQQATAVSTPPPRLSDDPLACTSRPMCCPRWTTLACLSICLPCLCLYPALRAGAKLVQWCFNRRVGLRGCRCRREAIHSEPPSVGFMKDREEGMSAPGTARCLFIVMEDS